MSRPRSRRPATDSAHPRAVRIDTRPDRGANSLVGNAERRRSVVRACLEVHRRPGRRIDRPAQGRDASVVRREAALEIRRVATGDDDARGESAATDDVAPRCAGGRHRRRVSRDSDHGYRGPTAAVGPFAPVEPFAPVTPMAPVAPLAPVGPRDPVDPRLPVTPLAPVTPFAPVVPFAPVTPVAPVVPRAPVGPDLPVDRVRRSDRSRP